MEEQEWLNSTDPVAMVHYLAQSVAGEYPPLSHESPGWHDCVSRRKLRLYLVAVTRQITHLFLKPASHKVIQLAEDHADGKASAKELHAAWAVTGYVPGSGGYDHLTHWIAPMAGNDEVIAVLQQLGILGRVAEQDYTAMQSALLREIFGNPLIHKPGTEHCDSRYVCETCNWQGTFNPNVYHYCPDCTGNVRKLRKKEQWLTPTVVGLALTAYEKLVYQQCPECWGIGVIEQNPIGGPEPNPDPSHITSPVSVWNCPVCGGTGQLSNGYLAEDRLGVLSDALEDAGCTEQVILQHLRGYERCWACSMRGLSAGVHSSLPELACIHCNRTGWAPLRSPHVKGCWVLDLLLGKE